MTLKLGGISIKHDLKQYLSTALLLGGVGHRIGQWLHPALSLLPLRSQLGQSIRGGGSPAHPAVAHAHHSATIALTLVRRSSFTLSAVIVHRSRTCVFSLRMCRALTLFENKSIVYVINSNKCFV